MHRRVSRTRSQRRTRKCNRCKNRRWRSKIRQRGGRDYNTKDITAAILSWKSYKTIENTLNSYKKNGLLDITTPFIYFQELGEREKKLADQYGVRAIGSSTNVGLTVAMFKIVEEIKTPYFLFCENDWELIHGKEETEKILKESITLLEEKGVNVVRLRDRKDPGEPLYSREWSLIADHEYKLDTLHTLEKPEEAFPGVFTIIKVGGHDWYTTTEKDTKWSNNPFLVKTEWMRKNVLTLLVPAQIDLTNLDPTNDYDKLNAFNFEFENTLKVKLRNAILAQGSGLFRHNRMDR